MNASQRCSEEFLVPDDRWKVARKEARRARSALRFAHPFSMSLGPDGQSFLMTKPEAAVSGEGPRFVVVENWFEELKRRVPTNR